MIRFVATGYGDNTIQYQLYFLLSGLLYSISLLPGKSEIVQSSSRGLVAAKSEQGQQFLSPRERWRNQATTGQGEGER